MRILMKVMISLLAIFMLFGCSSKEKNEYFVNYNVYYSDSNVQNYTYRGTIRGNYYVHLESYRGTNYLHLINTNRWKAEQVKTIFSSTAPIEIVDCSVTLIKND